MFLDLDIINVTFENPDISNVNGNFYFLRFENLNSLPLSCRLVGGFLSHNFLKNPEIMGSYQKSPIWRTDHFIQNVLE